MSQYWYFSCFPTVYETSATNHKTDVFIVYYVSLRIIECPFNLTVIVYQFNNMCLIMIFIIEYKVDRSTRNVKSMLPSIVRIVSMLI